MGKRTGLGVKKPSFSFLKSTIHYIDTSNFILKNLSEPQLLSYFKRETHVPPESYLPCLRAGSFMEFLLMGSLDTDTVLGLLSESSGLRYSTRTAKKTSYHGGVMKTNTPSVAQRQSSACRNQFNQEAALQLLLQKQVLQGHQETHLLLI